MISKKGQESGTLQNLLFGLLAVVLVSVLAFNFLFGLSTNYGVTMGENYTAYQKLGEVNSSISELTSTINNDDNSQADDPSIINVMVTGGYQVIKLVFNLPSIFSSILTTFAESLGIPAIVVNVAVLAIVVTILFAAIAMIMKVRA